LEQCGDEHDSIVLLYGFSDETFLFFKSIYYQIIAKS